MALHKGERLPETEEQIEAFEQYYLLPNRSIHKLAAKLGKNENTLQYWYNKFDWKARCEERDKKLKQYLEKKALRGMLRSVQLADDLVELALDNVAKKQIRITSVADIKKVVEVYQLATTAANNMKSSGMSIDLSIEATNTLEGLLKELASSDNNANVEFAEPHVLEAGEW